MTAIAEMNRHSPNVRYWLEIEDEGEPKCHLTKSF